jgi:Tol biopolymer transport system component
MRNAWAVLAALVCVATPVVRADSPYTIAYASFAPLDADIFLAAADGSAAKPFLPSPAQDWNASFSYDGRWVVFTSTRNGSADIYRAHPWSPDGRRIVFRAQDERGKGLRILDVESGQISVLTEAQGQNDNFPAWSPTGDEIAFTSDREDRDWEIYAIRPDGTGLRRVTRIPGNDAHPSWSPDGAWIAFATGRAAFRDEMALHPHNPQSYGDIAVIRADGSDLHLLTDNPWEDATPRWAPAPGRQQPPCRTCVQPQ